LPLALVWFLLTAATAGVFLHAGIKFPWFVFFQKDSGLRPSEPPLSMRLAMLLFAALCIGIGVFPGWLYRLLPYPVDFVAYTPQHVLSQLQLLLFSGLAFFLLLKQLARTEAITLDLDWLYRRLGPWVALRLVEIVEQTGGRGERLVERTARWWLNWLYRHHGPQGILARTWPTGSMAFWATLMLGAYLILYYW
jgi:multicomponent Na+:H+ antiporter subunit D